MKKKILLATPIYPPEIGGPATYTKELSQRLHDKYDLTILTYGEEGKSPVFPGTKLITINKSLSMPIRVLMYTLKLLSISKDFDLIYVQNAVASGLPVAINKMIRKTPFILKFVGDEAWERATQRKETTKFLEDFLANYKTEKLGKWIKVLLAIQRFTLQKADIVTTPSQYLGEALIKNYGVKAENFLVNYNASETEDKELEFPVAKKEFQVCTTARLTKWKNIDGLIEAIKIVKPKFPELSFVTSGDGPELTHLQNLTKKLDAEGYVKFLGRVSREETYKLRKESAIYILNSTYEGLPHTALTTFQARIPIIATDTPGTNEAVYDGVTGLLVPVNNPNKLAEAIERLLNDKGLQKKLVEGGTKILNEKFSWEAHIKNLESFFNKISKK
jgi:glycosyltransferase involved in cell wall biosynthesis